MTPLQIAAQQALEALESGALLCEVTAASMLRVALEAEQAQAVECTSDEWLANCPQSVRDLANKIKQVQAVEPVAYATFADNGNIRIWTKFDTCKNVKDLKPLYLQPVPAQPPAAAGERDHVPDAGKTMDDFDMRGVLASNLLCWHRLTEAEAQDLICFFEKVRAQQVAVPMADEQIRQMLEPHYSDPFADYLNFARAIEAHHRITQGTNQ